MKKQQLPFGGNIIWWYLKDLKQPCCLNCYLCKCLRCDIYSSWLLKTSCGLGTAVHTDFRGLMCSTTAVFPIFIQKDYWPWWGWLTEIENKCLKYTLYLGLRSEYLIIITASLVPFCLSIKWGDNVMIYSQISSKMMERYKIYFSVTDLFEGPCKKTSWVIHFGSFMTMIARQNDNFFLKVQEPGTKVGLAVCRTCLATE